MGNQKKTIWKGPRLAAFLLAMVPVVMFAVLIVNLVWNSIPVFKNIPIQSLLSTHFSSRMGDYKVGFNEYGLLPTFVGTFQLVILSMMIAFPIALAMAIFASEFSLGGLGRGVEVLLALFSGIPPVLYGLLSIFVLTVFVRPKFAGTGLSEGLIRTLVGDTTGKTISLDVPFLTSTFLGAIMVAMLIIPFITPIIVDAIRNVPQGLKEASLALGATRWYTLWHVTLPSALSGIASAVSLGALKVIGEVIIVIWTIGYLANQLPNPIWDVFESKTPLSAITAGLTGVMPGAAPSHDPIDVAVSYFSGLVLMVIAFIIIAFVGLTQRYLRRKLSQ